jgi:hypothetical protein
MTRGLSPIPVSLLTSEILPMPPVPVLVAPAHAGRFAYPRRFLRPFLFCLLALGLVGCSSGGGGGDPADTTAPTVTLSLSPAAVQSGETITATLSFSEDVSGLEVADITLAGGTAGTLTAVDARTYTLAITAGGSGTTVVEVSLPAGAAQDAAGNGSTAGSLAQAAVAYAPWASASGSDAYGVWADLTVAGNNETAVQRFRLIASGTFQMGSPSEELGRSSNETQHAVTISEP